MSRLLSLLRSIAVRISFLAIALAMAIWAVVTQWDDITTAVAGMSTWLLAGSLLASICYVVLTMLAWRVLLADMGTYLPLSAAARIFFVSQLGKYLPGGVWNILAAAELGADHQIPRRRSVSVMAVSVIISIVTGLALTTGTMPFAPQEVAQQYWWTFLLLPVFLIVLLPPVLNRLLLVALRLTGRPPLEVPISWRGMFLAAGWTLASWAVAGLQVWLLAIGLGMPMSPATFLLAVGGYAMAWTIGFLVIFVPAGAGVREAVLALVFAGTLPRGGVIAVVLLSRVVLTAADLALGGIGLQLHRNQREHRAAE